MKPLAEFPAEAARHVTVVLTDIDDTLTERGRLPAIAYSALERLKTAGIIVVPVTGRPAGWCDLIARQWPVDGVVGENGAFWFRYDDTRKVMVRRFQRDAAMRREDARRLDEIAEEVLHTVPGAAISADQQYRAVDLAIDFCEDVPPLPAASVAEIARIFVRHGATAKVSSIHVNGWFGTHDKLTCSLAMLQAEFGIDAAADRTAVVFAGDSPNDAPMFNYFPHAVGVANVLAFRDSIAALPAYVTRNNSAGGFVEIADLLIAARS